MKKQRLERDRFEEWISSPPIEASTERLGRDTAWPGNYVDYKVQLAWEAWRMRSQRQRPLTSSDDLPAEQAAQPAAETPRDTREVQSTPCPISLLSLIRANVELGSALVDAILRADALAELVCHCWVHSGYADCGYDQMTREQRALYCQVIGRTEGPNYQAADKTEGQTT